MSKSRGSGESRQLAGTLGIAAAPAAALVATKQAKVAMAVTLIALLAISIPFVWQHSVEAEPGLGAGVAPVASHDSAADAPNPKKQKVMEPRVTRSRAPPPPPPPSPPKGRTVPGSVGYLYLSSPSP